MSESLPALAGVLRAAPESDALVILGRLLDSLPIPVLLTDCSDQLRCIYGNAPWRAWVPPDKFPVEGRPLPEILEGLAASPLLPILRQVCATGATSDGIWRGLPACGACARWGCDRSPAPPPAA